VDRYYNWTVDLWIISLLSEFVSEPSLNELAMLKRSELVVLATLYNLEVSSGMRKDVWKFVSNYLGDKNIVSEEEGEKSRDP